MVIDWSYAYHVHSKPCEDVGPRDIGVYVETQASTQDLHVLRKAKLSAACLFEAQANHKLQCS